MALRFLLGALVLLVAFYRKTHAANRQEVIRGCAAGTLLFAAFYA